MGIKRLTQTEFVDVCKNVFYDFMASTDQEVFYENRFVNSGKGTPVIVLHNIKLDAIQDTEVKIELFREALKRDLFNTPEKVEEANRQIKIFKGHLKMQKECTMKKQKERFEKTGDIFFNRSVIRVPLSKRINAFYDDLFVDVIFYDDLTMHGKNYAQFRKLATKEERMDFIKSHVEITHMIMRVTSPINASNTIASCLIVGEPCGKNKDNSNRNLLPIVFSDFANLKLKDVEELDNNDLQQYFQEKIDMDSEGLKEYAHHDVGGCPYWIYGSNKNDDKFYIRYICPSTGRIYYNALDLNYLAISKYYESDKPDSYIDAWWNLAHLGANPKQEKEVISC